MVLGTNVAGETSEYIYNGLGYLSGQEWMIQKNAYGYTNVSSTPALFTFEDFITEYEGDVAGYIEALIGVTPDPLDGLDYEQPLVIVADPDNALASDEANYMLPAPVIAARSVLGTTGISLMRNSEQEGNDNG